MREREEVAILAQCREYLSVDLDGLDLDGLYALLDRLHHASEYRGLNRKVRQALIDEVGFEIIRGRDADRASQERL